MGTSADAALERAFALAFFFHPDRRTALLIATQAAGKLRLAERAQVRRGYYRPIGRRAGGGSWTLGSRTKVSVERSQLLQRLVLHESEAIERASESNAAEMLSDDELALRFVKHLVRSSSQRNSLYVAVAIGRILHGYQTAEVLDLLSTLAQDPERVPEDSYLRHVKGAQIREIKERFGGLLRTETGARGEEFIVAAPPTPSQRFLVNRALELLTPWDTTCTVPSAFDAMRHPLKALRFAGRNPDDEHAIEVNRMHSLIHPECFHRLATGLRLDSPADRLRIPKPFRSSPRDEDDSDDDGVGATQDRTRPPRLSRSEVERYRLEQSRLDRERRDFSPSRIALRVDGRVRLNLEAQVGARATCILAGGAEVMEAWGKADGGEEALLAVHVLRLTPPFAEPFADASTTADAVAAWEEVVVPLRGGRELVVTLTLRPDAAVGDAIELVAACRASSLAARWLSPSHSGAPSWWQGLATPIAAVSVLLATGLVIYVARRSEPVNPVFDERPPISVEAGERTRGRSTTPAATTLADARLLFLDLDVPEGADAARLDELLRIELVASGRFDITPDVDVAHAALKGALVAVPASPGGAPAGVRLELSLVDERGEVLWSTGASGDSVETVARRAVADLVARAR